jgi:hypothetical protein
MRLESHLLLVVYFQGISSIGRHSPWAFQRDTLKIHKRVAFHLLDVDLVPHVLALGRKQIQVEPKHLACSSSHCTLGLLGGFLGFLKIDLESSLHGVFGSLGHSFGFFGLSLGFFLGFL